MVKDDSGTDDERVVGFGIGNSHAGSHVPIPRELFDDYAVDSELKSNAGTWLNITDELNNAQANEQYGLTPPTAFQRWFAVMNLPMAWKITFGISADCFKSGEEFPYRFGEFQVGGGEFEPTAWSPEALNTMRETNFFETLRQMVGISRMDGEALIILMEEGFDWEDADASATERDYTKPIVDTMTLPMFYINQGVSFSKEEYMANGKPKFWYVRLSSIDSRGHPFTQYKKIHHSRIIHHTPDPIDTSTTGMAVLTRCWQALMIGWNIDVGIGEAFFRWGPGHPVIYTNTKDVDELKQMMDNLGPITRRTWHAFTEDVSKMEMVGVNGTMLDVENAKKNSVYDEVAMGAAIPRPILKGEVAGVLTGSEVNERSYFATLRQIQQMTNNVIWEYLAVISESNKMPVDGMQVVTREPFKFTHPKSVVINWAVHYVETEREKIDKLLQKVNILTGLGNFLDINETRAFAEDLLNQKKGTWPPKPPEVGEQIISIFEPTVEQSAVPGENTRECTRCGRKFVPKDDERTCPTCSNASRAKSGEPHEHGNKLRKREDPVKPNITQQTGEADMATGCPRHERFVQMCPDCQFALTKREELARHFLIHGHGIKNVRKYTRLDNNKVVEMRKAIDAETREKG